MEHPPIDQPLVSIGLPIFEEERYLRLTIESLLAQDYPNFKLIICDNASADGTENICKEFQAKDPRVRYFRSQTNIGAIANFNRALELADGKYFLWAGGHDLWEPTFISVAVGVLESNPEVVLVYPRATRIDDQGRHHGTIPDELDTQGLAPLNRYLKLIWNLQSCTIIHGLMRAEVVRSTKLFRKSWACDITLLSELSLKGEFARLPQVLFYRRDFRPQEQEDLNQWKSRALTTVEGPQSKRLGLTLPELFREMRNEQLRLVFHSNLRANDKLRAIVQTIKWARAHFGVTLPGDFAFRTLAAIRSPRTFFKRLRNRFQRAQPRGI
jgi:glycosyltransferase involved in cell wall biosynthesis